MALFIQDIYMSNSGSTNTTTASIMDKTRELLINVHVPYRVNTEAQYRAGRHRLVDATLSETL